MPAPDDRPAYQRPALDVTSELQQKFQRKRRQQVQEAVAQEGDAWIAPAAETAARLQGVQEAGQRLSLHSARALLAEAQQRVADCPGDQHLLLSSVPTWRADIVDDLQRVLNAVDRAEEAAAAAEVMAANAGNGGGAPSLAPDLLQAAVRRVLQAVASLVPGTESVTMQAAMRVRLATDELRALTERSGSACRPLLQQLLAAAQRTQALLSDPGLRTFDRRDRAASAHRQYTRYCELCADLDRQLRLTPRLSEAEEYAAAMAALATLRESFSQAIAVQTRQGQWDTEEQVHLKPAGSRPLPPPRRSSDAGAGAGGPPGPRPQAVARALQRCDVAAAAAALDALAVSAPDAVLANYTAFIRAAVGMQPEGGTAAEAAEADAAGAEALSRLEGLDMLLSHASCPSAAQLPSRDCQWLYAAVASGSKLALGRLTAAGLNLDDQSTEMQFTALHFAGRRGDLALVASLLQLGASPSVRDARGRTGLQVAAEWLKAHGGGASRPAAAGGSGDAAAAASGQAADRLDLGRFVCDSRFSDVTFQLDDGATVPAHRVVLCGRSDFFKAMFESGEWAEGAQPTVQLADVDQASLRYALDYIYTGECLYPRGQLQVGCDLLRVSNMFLLEHMQRQVEALLEEQLRADNVVAIAQQAYSHGAPRLLRHALVVALEQFEEVVRLGGAVAEEALLGLLSDVQEEDLAVREHLRRR